MGLANWLTVLRILLIPVFVSLLVYRKPGPALVVFVAAALTDLLDGYVARRHGLSSPLGPFLAPMAAQLLPVSPFLTPPCPKAPPFCPPPPPTTPTPPPPPPHPTLPP